MGLLDILTGMQNGPRGRPQPTRPGEKSGGMSPIMLALLGLLAYKAYKGGALDGILGRGQQAPSTRPPDTADAQSGGLGDLVGDLLGGNATGRSASASPGGLGDLLGGLLGGTRGGGGLGDLLAGGAAGTMISRGLDGILKDLQASGHSREAASWVGRGENEPIRPDDLRGALGADTIQALSQQTGVEESELLRELSESLPQLVDRLTPEGHVPTADEAARL